MPALSLRPAAMTDAAFFVRLEEACMRGYAEALWGEWRPSATEDGFDPAGMRIIRADAESVGILRTRIDPGCLVLRTLYLAPDRQNRGVGAWALRTVLAEAREAGLPVRLTVLTTNPARRFYEREGFVLESETPERWTLVRR